MHAVMRSPTKHNIKSIDKFSSVKQKQILIMNNEGLLLSEPQRSHHYTAQSFFTEHPSCTEEERIQLSAW